MIQPFYQNNQKLLTINFFIKNSYIDAQVDSKHFSEKKQIFLYKNF